MNTKKYWLIKFFLDYVLISELFKLYPKYFPILLKIKKISFNDIYTLYIYNTSNKKYKVIYIWIKKKNIMYSIKFKWNKEI